MTICWLHQRQTVSLSLSLSLSLCPVSSRVRSPLAATVWGVHHCTDPSIVPSSRPVSAAASDQRPVTISSYRMFIIATITTCQEDGDGTLGKFTPGNTARPVWGV
ncbi:hypothetical protein F4780DRAFT_742603 [Xylariomycetidae sp. FL0641]|nr:hypothetical protein F4780DRAFT_742603 [Xylariomycetidae sp. FL0641]